MSSEYDRILAELKEKVKVLASEYIPKLYQALIDEWHTPKAAKKKIEKDCKGIWTEQTIRTHLPEESKDTKLVAAGKKGNEKRAKIIFASKTTTVAEPPEIASSIAVEANTTSPTPKIEQPIAAVVGASGGSMAEPMSTAEKILTQAEQENTARIRLPIKLNLRLYFPALAQSWRAGRHEVTLVHDGNEVVEVKYLG